MTKPKHNSYMCAKPPKAEKDSIAKHYQGKITCPNCGNRRSDKIIRLHHWFHECELCGEKFTTDESL